MKKRFEQFDHEAPPIRERAPRFEVIGLPLVIDSVPIPAGSIISGKLEDRLHASLLAGGNLKEVKDGNG